MKRLCTVLGVSRSGFYYWRRTATDRVARQVADARSAARIRAVHQESDGTYGSPRITAELREASSEVVNHKRVARIMRASGIDIRDRHRRHQRRRHPAGRAGPHPVRQDHRLRPLPLPRLRR
ncbi:IS3 family transposase [Streptomyces sp. IBSBF 2507]|uniref:IS3 family transposase n=1 Tax=Streptomyces sp. IBSBF 2507 TaxID=2903530 RepID=UPI00351EED70